MSSPRTYFLGTLPSSSEPNNPIMNFSESKFNNKEPSINLFQRQDSDVFKDRLNGFDKIKSKAASNDNPFVNDDFMDIGETPRSNRSNYFTRSNSNRALSDSTLGVKKDSVIKPKPMMFKTPSMRKLNTGFTNQGPSLASPGLSFGNA